MFNYQKIKTDLKKGDNIQILSVEEHEYCYHLKCNRIEAKNKKWYGEGTIDLSDTNTICIPILKDENKQETCANDIKSLIEDNKKTLNGGHVIFGSVHIPIVFIDYFPEWKIGSIEFNENEWDNINKNGEIISFNINKGDVYMENCQIYYDGVYTREITDGSKTIMRTYVPFSYN